MLAQISHEFGVSFILTCRWRQFHNQNLERFLELKQDIYLTGFEKYVLLVGQIVKGRGFRPLLWLI
jgi:hypothetical protein